MNVIELTIDGRTAKAAKGQTILDAATAAGIAIPTLCHCEGLKDVGGCRMCIVEVEGVRRPVPACTTPAEAGMVVRTDTPLLQNLRHQTLELLFSERNHICPFCTRSGHCELQDLGYTFGMTHVRFPYLHPVLPVDQSHPEIAIDHNRCILCTRCVRVCDERIGVHTLDLESRGGKVMVTADHGLPLGESSCISCGACVQVCPTGALFEKRTSHWQHARDVTRIQTLCPACDVGCAIDVQLINNAVLSVRAADGPSNHGLLCRHGRYGLSGSHGGRLLEPKLRRGNALSAVTYDAALADIAKRLTSGLAAHDRSLVAGAISGRLPLETIAAFRLFLREVVGTERVGTLTARHSRAVREATGGEFVRGLAQMADLDAADLFLLVGARPEEEQGVIGMAVRRGVYHRKATLIEINPARTALSDRAAHRLEPRYGTDLAVLNGLLKSLIRHKAVRETLGEKVVEQVEAIDEAAVESAAGVAPSALRTVASLLASARRPMVLVGPGLTGQGAEAVQAALNLALARGPDKQTGRLGLAFLLGSANASAAMLTGLDGFDITATDPHSVDVLFLAMGDEDALDARVRQRIRAVPYTVVFGANESALAELAGAFIPTAVWSEREGTFLNFEGRIQHAVRVWPRPDGIRAEADVLTELAVRLGWDKGLDSKAATPGAVREAANGDVLDIGRQASELPVTITRFEEVENRG